MRAELLSIGSELTVGDTRDTNSGELAASLTGNGVEVVRMTALPDDLETVTAAWIAGMERADLVVSTGGLGPTPDDLTREAIAAAVGEAPVPDPDIEAWLRGLFERRGNPLPSRQPEASVADPLRHFDPQWQRHGTRLVGRSTGRRSDRRAAGTSPRAAPDVG